MAHKKGGGTSRNGRDSAGQRYGVKVFDSETVVPGAIIVRQRGTKFYPGTNTGMGSNYTIYSTAAGTVSYGWGRKGRRVISVTPAA